MIFRICSSIVLVLFSGALAASGQIDRRTSLDVPLEKQGDPPAFVWRTGSSPRMVTQFGEFTSYQVNVDVNGQNVTGDAANEPSITMDPTDPEKMAIGWRQFYSINSNFRQGAWAFTSNRGASWNFPGVLDNTFRSDPVLVSDPTGSFFYLSLVPNFYTDLWRSNTSGASWSRLAHATGGDKQWFTIDTTSSSGRGFQYQSWSTAGNNYGGRQFSRSTDGGLSWADPIAIPNGPSWGTLDVDTNGNLFIGGVSLSTGEFWCVRSSDAKSIDVVTPSFDQSTLVDLGGQMAPAGAINPEGLTGQIFLAVDRSGTSTNNNIYMLASVQQIESGSGTDVKFVKSTDGGKSFSAPRTINDDAFNPQKWHWFGTMAVAPNGRIDVVWLDTRNATNHFDSQLFYSYSTDGGENWSPNIAVSNPFDPRLGYPNQSKMGDYITIVSDNDGGNVAYCATFNLEQDIYYVRVTPSEVTPSPTPLPSPSPEPTVPPTASPTPTATAAPTAAPEPSASATPTAVPSASPSPTASPAARIGNIATRLRVETGDNVLIGGFIITGRQPKKLIIRAIGPSIDVDGALADPQLEVFNSAGESIGVNDNWRDAANAQEISDSTIAPEHELEAAFLDTLNPGAYSAVVSGVRDATGLGLVEAYDLDPGTDSRLANIATRGFVQTADDVMIGGLIVVGERAQKVLVRAIGPSLQVDGKLNNPALQLHDGNGELLQSNDDWRSDQEQEIIGTTIPPSHDLEAAIVRALMPAAYTAVVRGADGATGIALVEVYALD